MFEYTAVIRTLGTAGEAYQKTLDSVMAQTVKPAAIVVYIAEGYPLPKETVGIEKYVYVKKGMVAQRALPYDEVETEWILFLDDDVCLPENAVETLFRELGENDGDVISPCTFANHKVSWKTKLILGLTGKEVCRPFGQKWGYKVLRTGGFSYNNNPTKAVYQSQTNAGPCFLMRKRDFVGINYEDEIWLEGSPYALPDDQVMFYKMHLNGLKVLTSFDSGIVHLDAGSTIGGSYDKTVKIIYSEWRNKLIFWHKFIYRQEKNPLKKVWSCVAIGYAYGFQMLNSGIRFALGKRRYAEAFWRGLKDGINEIKRTRR